MPPRKRIRRVAFQGDDPIASQAQIPGLPGQAAPLPGPRPASRPSRPPRPPRPPGPPRRTPFGNLVPVDDQPQWTDDDEPMDPLVEEIVQQEGETLLGGSKRKKRKRKRKKKKRGDDRVPIYRLSRRRMNEIREYGPENYFMFRNFHRFMYERRYPNTSENRVKKKIRKKFRRAMRNLFGEEREDIPAAAWIYAAREWNRLSLTRNRHHRSLRERSYSGLNFTLDDLQDSLDRLIGSEGRDSLVYPGQPARNNPLALVENLLRLQDARRQRFYTRNMDRAARQMQIAGDLIEGEEADRERAVFSALTLDDADDFFNFIQNSFDSLDEDDDPYILLSNGHQTYFTLTPRNLRDVRDYIMDILENEDTDIQSGSDTEIVRLVLGSPNFYVSRVVNNASSRPSRNSRSGQSRGAMFPFTHTFEEGSDMDIILESFGCFAKVHPENYKTNCLIEALQGQVSDSVIETLKSNCMRQLIPMRKLKEIGDEYGLQFEVHSCGASHIQRYGKGETVKLAVYKKHYFRYQDVNVCLWPFKNFNHACLRNEDGVLVDDWFHIRGPDGRKERSKKCNSLTLMKTLMEHGHLKPIDISTEGVFGSLIFDRVTVDYLTLQYPEQSVIFQYEEDPEDDYLKKIAIAKHMLRQRFGKEKEAEAEQTLRFLDSKFEQRNITNLKQQLNIIRRHKGVRHRVFFDFETTTDGQYERREDQSQYKKHEPYLCSFSLFEGPDQVVETVTGRDCGFRMLEIICEELGQPEDESDVPVIEMIAHNVTYDFSFIAQYLSNINTVEKGSNVMGGSAEFESNGQKITIEFKDSFRMFQCKLSDVPRLFGIEGEKEAMPYDLYTSEFLDEKFGILESLDQLDSFPLRGIMVENLEKWGCSLGDGTYDMLLYAQKYCEIDVEILSSGWTKFRDMFMEHLEIDINAYLTIPAVAQAYMEEMHVYDDVCLMSGTPLHFFQQACIGGRVMTANNDRQHIQQEQKDIDVTMLYSKSQEGCPGFPRGKPKVITDSVDWRNTDYYCVKVKVISVGRKLSFPVVCVKNKDGGNEWVNPEPGAELILDTFMLQDFERFQNAECEFIQGYYFDQGFNTNIKSVVRHIFDKRVEFKRQKNPAQLIYKLLLNSGYGKNGQKPIRIETKYVDNSRLTNYIHNHHNEIREIHVMRNGQTRVKEYRTIGGSSPSDFNRQHVADIILSWSKHWMNKAMNALPNQDHISYTDTDSLHILSSEVEKMDLAYQSQYGEPMLGENELGKFHNDFSFDGCWVVEEGKMVRKNLKAKGEIVSKENYAVGKKVYIDLLSDGQQEAYHIRMKGIPIGSIAHKVNCDYGGDPMALFKDLYEGFPVEFDLGAVAGQVMFRTLPNHEVVSVDMKRKMHFPLPGQYNNLV